MVKVDTRVFNEIRQMMASNIFTQLDMLKYPAAVVWYLKTVKAYESADWIEQNIAQFREGVLAGFQIDNTQKQQLKDIHTREYL